jgi:methylmalonyl-CoA mutase cobalamin-binding subunit
MPKIIAGPIGNCVHVAGTLSFLNVAEQLGYETEFLGSAVSVDTFVEAIREHDPDIVGVSYRLTPHVAHNLIEDFRQKLQEAGLDKRRFVFGGTPPVCEVAQEFQWFERCFNGLEPPEELWAYLRGESVEGAAKDYATTQIERLERKRPYPLLRHHFGLPSIKATVAGVRKIAEAEVLDVISIGPDQNAQESFFRQHEMDTSQDGAGGVPIRSADDLRQIHQAAQRGNFPLLRIYSGTRDLIKWAELAVATINNAWGAIPLCWYSTLDGRSKRTPEEAVAENQQTMRWYGERGIPVEVNEAHHWSMRDAHDSLAVVMAYLAAYNAKAMGVKHYIAQYMFNSPSNVYGSKDLAKMLAKMEMIESLHDDSFISMRQVRAGLLHLSPRMNIAKGQLAASTMLALAMKPHIIHVVGYSEGDHAATADDVIESCEIVGGVLRNTLFGCPEMAPDAVVQKRKAELLSEARVLVDAIKFLGDGADQDPLTSPANLAKAIRIGFLDAPHLKGNPSAAGLLQTKLIDGAVYAVNPGTRKVITETSRLAALQPPKD